MKKEIDTKKLLEKEALHKIEEKNLRQEKIEIEKTQVEINTTQLALETILLTLRELKDLIPA